MSQAMSQEQITTNWSKDQVYSFNHWLAVLIFSATTFLAFQNILALIAGYVLFFLITALPRVYKMFIFFIITSILTAIFPPLGIVLTISFFIFRIGYIIENWRAILAGILVYAYPFGLSLFISDFYYISLRVALSTAIIVGVGFHFLLIWLYRNKYSTKNALGAMGSAPILILMLILPFVADEIGDVIDFDDFEQFEASHGSVDHVDTTIDTVNPDIHTVEGHWRENPSGDYTYVEPHVRTDPDGIESNNISY